MPEVGLELSSGPYKYWEFPKNMRNPKQSEGSTRQSETQSVDNVHTPTSAPLKRSTNRIPKQRDAVFLCPDRFGSALQQTFAILESATFPFVDARARRATIATSVLN
ncbi:hypothetical protein FBY31_1716 [Arthrobacter sp. SLBN-100]|nr:hypothetical protein FBY31_1716 [Arthrobacter sp. SLBN-100]